MFDRVLNLQEFAGIFSEPLTNYFNELRRRSGQFGAISKGFMHNLEQSISKGTRKGPFYTYMGYAALSDTDEALMMHLAVAMELYNAALLVHDDVIDADYSRYFAPNLPGIYREKYAAAIGEKRADQFAGNMGIIGGDMFFGLAFEQFHTAPLPQEVKSKITAYVMNANFILNVGQQLDILTSSYKLRDLNEALIRKVNRLKNHWNIALPIVVGAYAAGATDEQAASLEKVAYLIGEAIQIGNDLDVWYIDYNLRTLGDIREQKKTLWLWYGWSSADTPTKAKITNLISQPNPTLETFTALKKILEEQGAKTKARKVARGFLKEARQELDQLHWMRANSMQQVRELVDLTDKRFI